MECAVKNNPMKLRFQAGSFFFSVIADPVQAYVDLRNDFVRLGEVEGDDVAPIVTPFVQVGTYPTRNFATLGPL